jgi:hypothetical protein
MTSQPTPEDRLARFLHQQASQVPTSADALPLIRRRLRRHAWRRGTAAVVAVAALLAGFAWVRPSLDKVGPIRGDAATSPATPACNFGSSDGGGHQLAIPLGKTLQDVGRRGPYADGALVVAEVGPAKAARYSYTGSQRPANGPAQPTVTPYQIRVLDRLSGRLNPNEAVLSGGQVGSCGQPVIPPPGLVPGRRALLILSPPHFQGATYQAEIREVLPIQDDEVFAYRGFWLTTDIPGAKRSDTYPGYDRFDPNGRPARGAWIPLSSIHALARQ